MELDDANEMVIREALRRLGPDAQLDPAILQEQIAEVVKQQGETIFAQLNEAARQQLRRDGLRMSEQIARLGRINEAIEYGRFLSPRIRSRPWASCRRKNSGSLRDCGRTPRAA
jgi:hypothetical protein